ncbi:hypothetical protein N7492_000369 [Penicillium capsulatum]|uniref:Ketoreductase domain-containing protein n=1 Tax=Penicillium capsulatum TaxID=69766 RepID=A0A9W9LYN3_9EURO|nr:hypothetical protein N7492_000369 [Penicillium capsulatum]KAJ6130567.1 hypothetical protein N7512_003347 [Penicillium capsulatum]
MSTSNRELTGKIALVTGSSRGIGAAIAIKLASRGADIAINYHASAAAAAEVAAQVRAQGVRAITVQADVASQADVATLFERVVTDLGPLDIVVSNSGVEHFAPIAEVTGEDIDRVFNVNVKGQYFVAQQAHKHLKDHGRLMLTASVCAVMGVRDHAVYAASKAAVTGMTKSLAKDFGPRGITVNCLAAAGVKTDMYEAESAKYFGEAGKNMTIEQIEDALSKWSPLGRVGLPSDVAGAAALIASADSQWITGQTLQVCGGAYMA